MSEQPTGRAPASDRYPRWIWSSYHNHSTWSDGKVSVAEMVEAAARLELDEVGLSDHLVLHPAGRVHRWAMPTERLGDYVDDVRRAAAAAPLPVRLGVEVDWFPGHGDAIRAVLARHDWDLVIGSVHEVDGTVIDGSAQTWERLGVTERDELHRGYWRAITDLATHGPFDIVAHLDLSKKFDQHPSVHLSAEIDAALDAIARADMVVELNTAGWHKPCRDAYPCAPLLAACRARDIAVTISADAHQPEHLARDFERAAERLRGAGYESIVRFARRERRCVPLP